MYIGLKVFVILLSLLYVFFTFIGVYTLDFSLISVGVLFAISILLVTLETRNKLTSPFK